MSNPLLTTPHSKVDSKIKEPLGVGSTPDCLNGVFQNKNNQFFDKQLVQNNFTEGHIENNFTEGNKKNNATECQIENYAIKGSKQIALGVNNIMILLFRHSELIV